MYDPALKRWNKSFPFHTTATSILAARPAGDTQGAGGVSISAERGGNGEEGDTLTPRTLCAGAEWRSDKRLSFCLASHTDREYLCGRLIPRPLDSRAGVGHWSGRRAGDDAVPFQKQGRGGRERQANDRERHDDVQPPRRPGRVGASRYIALGDRELRRQWQRCQCALPDPAVCSFNQQQVMGILEALEEEVMDPDDDVALPMERAAQPRGSGSTHAGGGWFSGGRPSLPGFSFVRTEGGRASASAAPETTMWPLTGGAVIVAEPLPMAAAAAQVAAASGGGGGRSGGGGTQGKEGGGGGVVFNRNLRHE